MSNRIDRQYLKPQIKIFENALIEWSVFFFVFMIPWVVADSGNDHDGSAIAYICAALVYYVMFGLIYMAPRTSISSYFAMRRVVMGKDRHNT